jgi:hypothetical protein
MLAKHWIPAFAEMTNQDLIDVSRALRNESERVRVERVFRQTALSDEIPMRGFHHHRRAAGIYRIS